MKIKIFMLSGSTAGERNLLMSFAQGIRLCLEAQDGHDVSTQPYSRIGRWSQSSAQHDLVEFVYDEAYSECDVGVIFGSWKPRDKGSHVTRTSVAYNSKRFIVIETPLINRRTQSVNDHWRIGINGFLNATGYWPQLSSHEADTRLYNWGIEWSGWRNNPDGHVVIALQLPGDASLRGIDINDWAYDTVTTLRKHTDRPIVIRNHPLCSHRAFADHETLSARLAMAQVRDLVFSDGYLIPWNQDLKDAYCTVTYTSGLAVDSVISGVPTIACDPGNFAWGVSSNFVEDVEALYMPDSISIMNWLRQLAGCQWSVEEMRNGDAWKALSTVLENLK